MSHLKNRLHIIVLGFFLVFVISGCAIPGKEIFSKERIKDEEILSVWDIDISEKPVTKMDLRQINESIQFYTYLKRELEDKLNQAGTWDDTSLLKYRIELIGLKLKLYQILLDIRKILEVDGTVDESIDKRIVVLYEDYLNKGKRLEKRYLESYDDTAEGIIDIDSNLIKPENIDQINKILHSIDIQFSQDDYASVVSNFLLLSEVPSESIPLRQRIQYAISLGKIEQYNEAIEVGRSILKTYVDEAIPELSYEYAQWLIKINKSDQAYRVFKNIVDLQKKGSRYAALSLEKIRYIDNLREAVRQDMSQKLLQAETDINNNRFSLARTTLKEIIDNFPDSTFAYKAEELLRKAHEAEHNYLEAILGDIEGLYINNNKFEEALNDLDEFERRYIDKGFEDRIQKMREELFRREEIYKTGLDTTIARHWEETYNRAIDLFNNADYEEAIEEFHKLSGTIYEDEAEKKAKEATDRFVEMERIRIGRIFMASRQANFIEEKMRYLSMAYDELGTLIEKYPDTSYINKLENNIESVRKEILRLDPDYFSEPETGESSRGSEVGDH